MDSINNIEQFNYIQSSHSDIILDQINKILASKYTDIIDTYKNNSKSYPSYQYGRDDELNRYQTDNGLDQIQDNEPDQDDDRDQDDLDQNQDDDQTDNDQTDNDQTDNDQTDNDQTDNDQTDNDQTDNDQTDNDQTDNDQTDNDQTDDEPAQNQNDNDDDASIVSSVDTYTTQDTDDIQSYLNDIQIYEQHKYIVDTHGNIIDREFLQYLDVQYSYVHFNKAIVVDELLKSNFILVGLKQCDECSDVHTPKLQLVTCGHSFCVKFIIEWTIIEFENNHNIRCPTCDIYYF
jgi:hypothetical protein